MKTITEKSHIDRLNEKGIVIEDIFKNKGKTFVRKSDGSILDQVYNASRIKKKYYYNNKCIYTEKEYDENSNYTFATYNKNEKTTCPNCGNSGEIKNFYDGCSYCGTEFNIDYGLKRYDLNPFQKLLNLNGYTQKLMLFNILILLFLNIVNGFDILLIIYSLVLFPFMCFICHFIFSILIFPYLIIKLIVNRYYEGPKIRSGEINKSKVISCLHYELNQYYYNNQNYNNLIDYDIIKYYFIYDKVVDNQIYIDIKFKIRKYYLKKKKIIRKTKKLKMTLKYNDINNTPSTHNIIMCKNCGASIDITKQECEYCNTKIPKIKEWYIEKFY